MSFLVDEKIAIFFLLNLLVACDSGDNDMSSVEQLQPGEALHMRAGRTFVYDCPNEDRYTVRIEGDTAWLFLSSGTVQLTQVPSASGSRYQEGSTVFWSKGDVAVLEQEGLSGPECRNNRAQAIWEDAKLRGADFRAVGNEPGWNLEISRSYGIVLVTNYGADKYTFALPEPVHNEASHTTTYAISENGHELTIILQGRRCGVRTQSRNSRIAS